MVKVASEDYRVFFPNDHTHVSGVRFFLHVQLTRGVLVWTLISHVVQNMSSDISGIGVRREILYNLNEQCLSCFNIVDKPFVSGKGCRQATDGNQTRI